MIRASVVKELKKVRPHLGELAHLTEPAHLDMNGPLVNIFMEYL